MVSDIFDKKRRSAARLAVVEPWCTGCGGAPICMVYCKKNALQLVKDKEVYPFHTISVNHGLCIGCEACVSKGKQGIMLSGCPWDAIRMKTPQLQQ
jgi:ferredoxin